MPDNLALSGLKVVDLTWVVVGPSAVRMLSDYGATVVHVESSTRPDAARTIGPNKDKIPGPERTGCFINFNAGKLGLTLNLAQPEAREVLGRLIAWADVLAEAFTPKAMRNWGLGPSKALALNPGLIYLSTSLGGYSGPHSQFAGYGNLGAALAGFNFLVGWPDRPPAGPNGAYTDYVASKFIVASILAALDHRDETGRGQHIDLSQAEAAMHFLSPALLDYEVNRRVLAPDGNHSPVDCPHAVYQCAGDDRWIAIAVTDDAQWPALCRTIGRPDLIEDPVYGSAQRRKLREAEIDALVEAWTAGVTAEAAQEMLIAAGVPCHLATESRDAVVDPQLAHRGHFITVPHAELGDVLIENSRFTLSRTPAVIERAGPVYGQDNEYVLREILGLDDDQVIELVASGALE